MPCRAMTLGHPRLCDLAAAGDPGYVAMLCGEVPAPADRAAILARRAGKVRIPLGVKVPPGRR